MKTIYRFDIPLGSNTQAIPVGAHILPHVAVSDRLPVGVTVWALVDEEAAPTEYMFGIVGTGWPLEEIVTADYLGTVHVTDLVFHVFVWDGTP